MPCGRRNRPSPSTLPQTPVAGSIQPKPATPERSWRIVSQTTPSSATAMPPAMSGKSKPRPGQRVHVGPAGSSSPTLGRPSQVNQTTLIRLPSAWNLRCAWAAEPGECERGHHRDRCAETARPGRPEGDHEAMAPRRNLAGEQALGGDRGGHGPIVDVAVPAGEGQHLPGQHRRRGVSSSTVKRSGVYRSERIRAPGGSRSDARRRHGSRAAFHAAAIDGVVRGTKSPL